MPDIWGLATILAKLSLYIGLLGATGLVINALTFADLLSSLQRRLRLQAICLAGLVLVAAVFGYTLRGAALTGSASGMADPEMLALLWQTSVGDTLALRGIGAVLIMGGLLVPHVGQWIALVGGMVALWSFTQIGHVPELPQTGVRLLLMLHLLGVALWVGVLAPLHRLSRSPTQFAAATALGHRFGQVATAVVPLLVLAGILMAWLLIGDLSALISTSYGQVLLLKLGLVGTILTIATANKLHFIPAMQAGDEQAGRHLARSIEIETLIITLVLAATATLTSVLTLPN